MDQETREHMQSMCNRITNLEKKVDRVLDVFEQATGAIVFMKWAGSVVLGIAALWAFFSDHIKIK